MITQCDIEVLEVLRKGLSDYIKAEDIRLEENSAERKPGILVLNTGFTITDSSIGGYGGEKQEVRTESFDTDGKKSDFTLETPPLRPLSVVEQPPGTRRSEPDDFTVDYEKGVISFRTPPDRGKRSLQVQYCVSQSLAEVVTLQADLDYVITIIAEEPKNRDHLMLELVKTLFDRRNFIHAEDLTEIRLVRGYLGCEVSPSKVLPAVLNCQIGSIITIEIGLPTIKQIDISQK